MYEEGTLPRFSDHLSFPPAWGVALLPSTLCCPHVATPSPPTHILPALAHCPTSHTHRLCLASSLPAPPHLLPTPDLPAVSVSWPLGQQEPSWGLHEES